MTKPNKSPINVNDIIESLKPLRVLKVGTCTNVSGKHKLTYHIGCDDAAVIHFRVYENSGGGYFSTEWVTLDTMLKAIEDGPKPTTSFALYELFKGKSVNTPAFLLAALLNEGLMQIHPDHPRCYSNTDSDTFMIKINQLVQDTEHIEIAPKSPKKHLNAVLMETGPGDPNQKIKTGRPLVNQRHDK